MPRNIAEERGPPAPRCHRDICSAEGYRENKTVLVFWSAATAKRTNLATTAGVATSRGAENLIIGPQELIGCRISHLVVLVFV
jgi:hypothetical protein